MKMRHRIPPNLLHLAHELRINQTTAESILWRALRNRNFKYKFRRQHPILRYIVDFYCPQAKLCVEIDGSTHYESGQEYSDAVRTADLEQHGCKVIRFTNYDVCNNIDAVVEEIARIIESLIIH
jgi:very-short-patch-repair endonuclease